MSMSIGARLGAGLAVGAVVIGAKFVTRGNAGADYLKGVHAMVAQVEGYADKPDYYDWLADRAHEECFSNAYHMDWSRRHDNSWIDDDRYLADVFTWMVTKAREDQAPHVAAAIDKFLKGHTETGDKQASPATPKPAPNARPGSKNRPAK